MRSRMLPFTLLLLAAPVATPLAAQLISLKTVPLATGEQFQLFPSSRVGVAALSIALADTLRDAVASPATGARLDRTRFFSAPVMFNYAGREGGGLTLPAGVFASAGRWFGGLAGAVQEMQPTRTTVTWGDVIPAAPGTYPSGVLPPQARSDSRINSYAFGLAGFRLGGHDAVALSAFHAWLQAVQGVEQMYDGAAAVVQDGDMLDLRLGYMHSYDDGGSLDVVLLRNALDMTHDVAWLEWTDLGQDTWWPTFTWEHNADRTATLGAYARYVRPVNDAWRAGVVFTVNHKAHPKIPNYLIMSIPRDPGTSTALEAGVGAAYEARGVVFGVDLLLEPAWTETWANAQQDITFQDSIVLVQAGDRLVENHLRFMNGVLRLGVARETDRFAVGAGLEMRSVGYHLAQYRFDDPWDLRRQDERWKEWTPTWGLALHLPGLELRYDGSVTFGSGAHNSGHWTPVYAVAGVPSLAGPDFLPAPNAPLNLDQLTVWTHQISVSVGRARR